MVSTGRRAPVLLAVLLVAIVGFGAPALAQLPSGCSPATLKVVGPTTLQASASQAFTVNVTNPNPSGTPGSVKLQTQTPNGWTATLKKTTMALAGGQSANVSGTLKAPAQGSGASAGDVKITATLTCGQSPVSQTADPVSKTLSVKLAAAPFPWTYVLGGAVLVVAAVLAFVYVRRQRATVELDCRQPMKDVAPGRGASFPLTVSNRRGEADTVRLQVLDVPEGWSAFVAVPEVELEAQESRDLWLMVRAPADAQRGATATVTIEAVPARGDEGDRVMVQANVVALDEAPPAS